MAVPRPIGAEERALPSRDHSPFAPNALRLAAMFGPAPDERILAVVAAGRIFLIDPDFDSVERLEAFGLTAMNLEAVLISAWSIRKAFALEDTLVPQGIALVPVYGPTGTNETVERINATAGHDGVESGLCAWGPAPEHRRGVIIFEGEGLVVSATNDGGADHIAYRFDYRGRSVVIEPTTFLSAHDADLVIRVPFGSDWPAEDAPSAGTGMLVELPLSSTDVTVRPL